MTQDNKIHPAVEMFKTEYENGEMNRREFMARATTLEFLQLAHMDF